MTFPPAQRARFIQAERQCADAKGDGRIELKLRTDGQGNAQDAVLCQELHELHDSLTILRLVAQMPLGRRPQAMSRMITAAYRF